MEIQNGHRCRTVARSLFRQPIIPTAHCSDGPLFRQPIAPTAHFSDNPLFRQKWIFFFNFLPRFLPKKNLSGRKSQPPPPPPPIHKPCNPSKPSKVFFLLNFTQRSTPYVDVHEIIIKVCSDINGCI